MGDRTTPSFGALLSRYRMAQGLSQEQLAERARISARSISDLERGVSSRPHASTVHQLSEALQLSLADQAILEAASRLPKVTPPPEGVAPDPLPTGNFLGAVPPGAIVAREEELGRIRTILDEVAGGTGQLLTLVGELGVGKTRLAQEVMVQARDRGFLIGTGRCYQREHQSSYVPMFEALSEIPTNAPADVRVSVQQQWRTLRKHVGSSLYEGASPSGLAEARRALGAVADFLISLTDSAPVALLFDDLHWAGEGTLSFLHHLVHATRGACVLVLGTLRDSHLSEEHPALAHVLGDLSRERLGERMVVRRLSSDETATLAATIMGQETIAEDVAAFIYRRSKGNPRYIDQMVRSFGGRLQLQGDYRQLGAEAHDHHRRGAGLPSPNGPGTDCPLQCGGPGRPGRSSGYGTQAPPDRGGAGEHHCPGPLGPTGQARPDGG